VRPTARRAILDAANRIVIRDGVARLTLDAVAAEAGVSKGGLLYHFRSKEALITAMIAAYLDDFDGQLARLAEREPAPGDRPDSPARERPANADAAAGPGFDAADGPDGDADAAAGLDGDAGRWTRAYVRATFDAQPVPPELGPGLLAAVATDPALLDPVRERHAAWQARSEADGIDPTLAMVVRLAADGLAYADLFDFAPPSGVRRERVLALLLELARDARR